MAGAHGKTTIINPDTSEEKDFAFDYSYWSHDGFDTLSSPEPDLHLPGDGYNAPANRRGGASTSQYGFEYADQRFVYEGLGRGVLNNALDGFNCCLFAYGQTGSGKSYSFVGYGSNKGIVPQVCDEIFQRKVTIEATGKAKLQVTFSMMEIYNEKIRDLLNPDRKTNNDLKVRTTPKGTFVEGVKAKAVGSFDAINREMEAGTASRTVAATQMNATSSRAHTIMSITVKQLITEDGRTKEIASDMNLVDLAGSERAESTGATGDRLKEGAAINKSLSSLGNVISALAEQANNPKKKVFVPYRDSKLTQILQSALGGNSKTIMVAALSPADINFEETLSTLRYADRAKQIKVVVEVQENPTDKLIRQLKEENEKLKKMMESMGGDGFDPAAFAGSQGGTNDPPQGTITEDEMQVAIEKAVAEVKAASAQEKAAALEAVKAEMMARHEGLRNSMIRRADFEATLENAIKATGVSPAKAKSEVEKLHAKLDKLSAKRQEGGGKIGPEEAMHVMDEAIAFLQEYVPAAEFTAAKAMQAELLAPNAAVWADGEMSAEETSAVLDQILACMPGATAEQKKKAEDHCAFVFHTESQAAKLDMHSKAELMRYVRDLATALGGDVNAAVNAAEMRFDQLLRDAEDGAVDEAVMATVTKAAMDRIGASDSEKKAAMLQAKRQAGWNTAKNLNAVKDAQARAKLQIAQALAKNTEMMNDLAMSFDDKLSISEQEAKEQQDVLKSLGLGSLSKEQMKVTPSMRNLNQDPTMADALVYYLTAEETLLTTPDDGDAAGQPSIQLDGGGMMKKHGTIAFSRKAKPNIRYLPGAGAAFVNGKQVTEQVALKHDDRLILGNGQAFRIVDPLDPAAKAAKKQIIDWDLAQQELAEAMGTAVDLKVEEEVSKKKAELDAQLKAMEEKFARENEALRAELNKKGGAGSAANQSRLKALDDRKKALEMFRGKARLHVQEYKRDLIRLEDSLRKVAPTISAVNQMAQQLGRLVKYEPTLITHIPESTTDDPLSPVEELLTQKVTELMVRAVLHNPRTDMRRDWYWSPEPFSDRVAAMRAVWQRWMLEQTMATLHVPEDPFWAAPIPQLVGSAYLYLAPIAYSSSSSQWIPIINYRGEKQGELRVHLQPFTADGKYKTPLMLHENPESLLNKPLHFTLTIEQARGLMDCPNKNVRVEYTFADEQGKRTTPAAQGKKFDPKFGESFNFAVPNVTTQELTYLCKDAIMFEIWGEVDDVEEQDVAEAIAMELPPETFEFFLAHDITPHENGASSSCKLVPELLPSEPGHEVPIGTALDMLFSVAQADKHFKVAHVGRFRLGNFQVCDAAGNATPFNADWTTLQATKQSRASESEPWVVQIVFALPAAVAKPANVGKTFKATLQAEIEEIERLGLEEPLELVKELVFKLVDTGKLEGKAADAKKRLRATTVVQELYMGQFEVSDAAVNLAMMSLRNQGDDANIQKEILNTHEKQVKTLEKLMIEECARQYEDLALRAMSKGFDLAASLQLWQLPNELLGTGDGADEGDLTQQVAALKKQLAAAQERIRYLESASGATRAAQQINVLRKEMVAKRKQGASGSGSSEEGGKSKACVIS